MSESTASGRGAGIALGLNREKMRKARKMTLLYVFFLIPAVILFIFHYIPIYGIVIAFKDFKITRGILASPWNNFEHFRRLFFVNPFFGRIMRNTVLISLYRLVLEFPAPIVLALLINEVSHMGFKRVIQSITYLPHFMSWVVLATIIIEILSPQRGIFGYIYSLFGAEAPNLMTDTRLFRPMLIVTGVWQTAGWGTIVYLAGMAGIDPGMYESASIDGANRFQRAIHITLPSLAPIMTILFILRLGRILNAGFNQIFNLYNPIVYEVADIIDTYVYRAGIYEQQYDFATAVGLFKNVIGVTLILLANRIVKRFSEFGIW